MILMSRSDVERTDNVALEGPGDVEYPVRSDQVEALHLWKGVTVLTVEESRGDYIEDDEVPTEDVDEEKGIQFGLMLLILLTRLERPLWEER
jgi:hypothetical protein